MPLLKKLRQRNHNQVANLLNHIRRRRLIQICGLTAAGLIVALTVARDITFVIFVAGLLSLLLSMALAIQERVTASAYLLLGSMAAMLFALALTGAGVFDLAMLGFPGLLVFAAILGGFGLFFSVLIMVIAICMTLGALTILGIVVPHTPSVSWPHLVFINIILTIIGLSVFILVRDIKRLMLSLKQEHDKVQESQEHIQHLAHHDSLTGLPNRLYAEKLFQESLHSAQAKKHSLALYFIDLDNFKPVNDALGHAAGDELLQNLTRRLMNQLTEGQKLARFGGDEFIVLVPYTEISTLATIAESLIAQCASVFEIVQTQVNVSASVGITCAPHDGTDFKQLCRKADLAMYRAKEDGRNTYHFYDQSLDRDSEATFRLLQKLRPAVRDQLFDVHYQPMVSISTGKVCAYEALLRWPQPDGSYVLPIDFIPVAESSGLINQLGQWVLEQACQFCAQQRQSGHETLVVSVNLSAVQLKNEKLPSIVASVLSAHQLPADALELEITESVLIDNKTFIQTQFDALNQMGVSLAIDDFGTGYSNLSYLRDFKAKKLKIDRAFISKMSHNHQDELLVKAIINMANSLGLQTVAEGIEDSNVLEKLNTLGCDFGQGFYWAKPLPVNLIEDSYLGRDCTKP